ncbi:nitroreductase [Paenibacillus cellulosilyticus]|uniref:Nitroreductase n=1 Tax=Paenibacillus cellulosilyticus TaxID=375489 RepID=A0A2V2Z944_9BACL|nr:nitroreductase family protein [Paenibacillus cellulosilyticus]PWW08651.1 nitroreductase [Paenibacillus cellulosilyticus]QKS48215.1 nitroreductase family protein [Paenibacillus cellulosilyticus]
MTVMDLIKSRRTIKMFKPDPIAEGDLLAWLEAASYAPNHRLNEPWEIRMVGPETRARLRHKTDFGGAPVVLAIVSRPAATPFERDENVMAVSCFSQNLLLAAHEAGAGVYWASLGALPHNRDILGVPQDYDVIGVFGIGYPAEVPAARPRTPIDTRITYLD